MTKREKARLSKAERKLIEDVGRANRAIAIFKQWAMEPWPNPKFQPDYPAEIYKLQMAIAEPRLLWAMYRRGDHSGISYIAEIDKGDR